MRVLVLHPGEQISNALLAALEDQLFSVEETVARRNFEDFVQGGEYDCIILDSFAKDEALLAVRQLRRESASVGLVVLSKSSEASEARTTLYECGADECLSRPFSHCELVAKLRALDRRGHGISDCRLRVADLEIDCVRHTVHRSGKLLQLTKREFVLLEYLVRNADRPLTRSMIMERVWKQDYEGLTNVVDVFINLIRRKIDKEFEPKLVHTARGVGYLIRSPVPPSRFAADQTFQNRQTG